MADEKISKSDLDEWLLFVSNIDTVENDKIEDFAEEFEKFEQNASFEYEEVPEAKPSPTPHYLVNVRNLRAPTKSPRKGRIDIDASIDLHGKTVHNAYIAFLAFIESSYLHGHRNLLVITGKGKNSPDGVGLIKKELKTWTKESKIADKIVRISPACKKNGGDGAYYIFLKKHT